MQLKIFTDSAAWILTLMAIPVVGIAIFAVVTNRRGMTRNQRAVEARGSPLLSQYFLQYAYWVMQVPGRACVRLGIGANSITVVGFAIVLVGCVFAALGYFGLAGPLFLLGSLADLLDGFVAREQGTCSDAGEFLDAMVDRYADIAILAALCFYYAERPWAVAIVLSALMGSVMMSYARAKAESLKVWDAPSGFMRRAERAVYLGFGILLAPVAALWLEAPSSKPVYHLVLAACGLIATLSNLSAVQISVYTMRRLQRAPTKETLSPMAELGSVAEGTG